MTERELEMLATHLGHDPKTHKEYYRLAHSTIELSKVRAWQDVSECCSTLQI
jgi:hypothetical protein